jgi:hypothetical protein
LQPQAPAVNLDIAQQIELSARVSMVFSQQVCNQQRVVLTVYGQDFRYSFSCLGRLEFGSGQAEHLHELDAAMNGVDTPEFRIFEES